MQAKTIIVVEDDPLTRLDAVAMIEEAGFDVVEMETADKALSYVWRQPNAVAAIFSDVQTPGNTSGADLARTVSSHWPHIRMLITSGLKRDSIELPASSTFFPKPWFPGDVLGALGAVPRAA
jgi:CheY-like chemotaxis protein